jgi:hypothetical protein
MTASSCAGQVAESVFRTPMKKGRTRLGAALAFATVRWRAEDDQKL